MKFDVAIMNPPYAGTLHLKILEKVIPIAEKVVNISPIGWLEDATVFTKLKKTINLALKENVSKHVKDLEILPVKLCNEQLSIGSFTSLGIYTCDKNEYDMYKSVCWHNKSKTIFDKTVRKIADGVIPALNDKIKISIIHGNPGGKTEFDICTPQYKLVKDLKPAAMSENDFVNWHNSCNNKVMKYINKLSRTGSKVKTRFLPWLEDYSQPWDDKRLCEYFGITGYIDDEHAEPNSEWEIILNTMKEYV